MLKTDLLNLEELKEKPKQRVFYEEKNRFAQETSVFSKKHSCKTCKKEIGSEISRILLMRDKDGGPCLMTFHFFFPCWDFKQLCSEYPQLTIDKAGFSLPESISMNQNSLLKLQKNLEFWI